MNTRIHLIFPPLSSSLLPLLSSAYQSLPISSLWPLLMADLYSDMELEAILTGLVFYLFYLFFFFYPALHIYNIL